MASIARGSFTKTLIGLPIEPISCEAVFTAAIQQLHILILRLALVPIVCFIRLEHVPAAGEFALKQANLMRGSLHSYNPAA